ncbi:MAG: zinc ribbon domain-containing protein [Clostridiales bacterium]|jgi:hypothetical protein|nr:zinc ribbon domain-containing protein [Clostridiales bacterium]
MAGTLKCKLCGANITETMKFCGFCGASTKKTVVPNSSDSVNIGMYDHRGIKNKGNKFKILTTLLLSAALFSVIAAFVIYLGKPAEQERNKRDDEIVRVENSDEADSKNRNKADSDGYFGNQALIHDSNQLTGLFESAKYERYKSGAFITQLKERVAISNVGEEVIYIDGSLISKAYNLYSNKAAFLISERTDIYYNKSTLYFVDNELQIIDEEVEKCWISASGNAIAYLKKYDPSNNSAELWFYSNGIRSFITSDFCNNEVCFISPNGSTICYTTYDGEDYCGFVWDGQEYELGAECWPIAVSDGAKYIYYYQNYYQNQFKRILYVQEGENFDDREEIGEFYKGEFTFNRDLSQVIVATGEEVYISRNGGSKEPLYGWVFSLIVPNGTARQNYFEGDNSIQLYSVSSFANCLYYENSVFENRTNNPTQFIFEIISINSMYEANSIADYVTSNFNVNSSNVLSAAGSFYLADNAKTLTYIRLGSIFKANEIFENTEPEVIVSEGVRCFVAVDDGSAVFFVDNENKLNYQKGKQKPVIVSDTINYEPKEGLINNIFNGNTIYYESDGSLYFSNGGSGKYVSGIEGEVISLSVSLDRIIVKVKNNGDIYQYYSEDGENFKLLGRLV